MALPTSPSSISLNEIHIEAGGASGTTASINDADIRSLIGKGDGVTMSFNEWYGASGYLDTQTVTVGYAPGSQYAPAFYGYFSPNIGSVSDGTSNLYGGATILGLYWLSYNALYFLVSGNRANSGWSTMTVSGQTFNRVDATYSYSSGNNETSWVWGSVTTNPYTPTGANIGVEFN